MNHINQWPKALITLGTVFVFAVLTIFTVIHFSSSRVGAADIANFNPANIISNEVFYNRMTMSTSDIQSFLNSKVPVCNTNHASYTTTSGVVYNPPWICLKDYSMMTTQKNADAYCSGYSASNQTSAQIIYGVAQSCGVNPQVLIVLLQKEQSLIGDNWPGPWQYKSATGMGCPDTATCDSQYYGLFNQLYFSARQFKMYQASPTNYSYRAGRNNTIYYNPGPTVNGVKQSLSYCGSSQIYIQNQATAGLYNYTPYRPNDAALGAGYGIGNTCSAYGNRNFWLYFTDWFGSTNGTFPVGDHVKPAYKDQLGYAKSEEVCGIKDNGCYQIFQDGSTIYWSQTTGAHTLSGGIRAKWVAAGSEYGALGYPISDEMYGNKGGGAYQIFQNGRIYYTSSGKSIIVLNDIYTRWNQSGSEWGTLGYPTTDTVCAIKDNGCYQIFEDGSSIYWSSTTGAHTITGGIRAKWAADRGEWSLLGYPTSDELYGTPNGGAYQLFQNGRIIYTNTGNSYILQADIYALWSQSNAEIGSLGYPKNDTFCGLRYNGCYQIFQNDSAVYWTASTGAHTIGGGIRVRWAGTGSESSALGYPTSSEQYGNNIAFQDFEHGRITWYFDGSASLISYN